MIQPLLKINLCVIQNWDYFDLASPVSSMDVPMRPITFNTDVPEAIHFSQC
jgi:hypothetical protein